MVETLSSVKHTLQLLHNIGILWKDLHKYNKSYGLRGFIPLGFDLVQLKFCL
jgi:hypothetical protein